MQEQVRPGWLSNQPVQAKLMLVLGLVLAVFIVGTVAAVVAQDESDRARIARTETYDRIVGIDRLIRAVIDQQLTLRGYVISADPAFLDAHDNGRDAYTRQLAELQGMTQGNALHQTKLSQVSLLMDQYWEGVADPVLGWMEHPATRKRAAAAVASGQDGRYVDEMRRLLEEIQASEQEQLERRTRHVERSMQRTRWILLVVLAAGILLGALAIYLFRHQITNPLTRLTGLMERLAANDHSIEVPDQMRRDEVGAIARALEVFKRMALVSAADHWVKSGVAAIAARLHEARDFKQFAESLLDELAPRVGATVARVYAFHPDASELRQVASRGGLTGNAILALGEGAAGQCARLRVADVQPRHYPRLPEGVDGLRPDTAVLRPIVLGDALLGLIELGRAGRPEVKHERLLDELMPIIALSYENLARELRLQKSEEDLQRANEALRERSEAAHHQATHDPLTHLPNRLLFMSHLEQGIERSRRTGAQLGLAYIDIDGFKPVNDTHGHHAGDLLLCAIAARLLEGLRRSDLVARLGGDEFVVLMDAPDSEALAFEAVERLGRRLAEPYILNDTSLPETLVVEVGASIGLAMYPHDARSDDAPMKAADAAMYAAKQAGKNRCVRASELGGSVKIRLI